MADSFHHRSHLSQKNKSFKPGKHSSNRSLKKSAKGRVEREARQSVKAGYLDSKDTRRNQSRQQRAKKLGEKMAVRRGIVSGEIPPRVVTVLSAHSSVDPNAVISLIEREVQLENIGAKESDSLMCEEHRGVRYVRSKKWKQRLALVPLERSILPALELIQTSEVLLIVTPESGEMDLDGMNLIRIAKLQGCGTPIAAVMSESTAKRTEVLKARKSIEKVLAFEFGSDVRAIDASAPQELLRHLCKISPAVPLLSRSYPRPFLLLQGGIAADGGSVRVEGYLRGGNLCTNQLIHIDGIGDFQMQSVEILPDPYPANERRQSEGVSQVKYPTAEQHSLKEEEQTDFNAEQNAFLDDDEDMAGMMSAEAAQAQFQREALQPTPTKIYVPKGTSSYQATWIVESDEEYELEPDMLAERNDQDADMTVDAFDSDEEIDDNESTYTSMEATQTSLFNLKTEEKMQRLRALEQEDSAFPDEVDTPLDEPARVRFQKYRMLKSFRTTYWDPKLMLPQEYSKIIQFRNMKKTMQRVMSETDSMYNPDSDTIVSVGSYVAITLSTTPQSSSILSQITRPIVLVGLYRYEKQVSVMNFSIQRTSPEEYAEPIKAKEPLLFYCGFRKIIASPIYSEDSLNDKHRLIRFLPHNAFSVATIYGPITFPPAPVLAFKNTPDGDLALVGYGSVHSIDPDRLVLKRITLTGYPFKIAKRRATIRFMFYNPEDVRHYKPVELRTKLGRTGHIIDSLGTHGYMKCRFDSQLKPNDTICLHLYKRVYPKWRSVGMDLTNEEQRQLMSSHIATSS